VLAIFSARATPDWPSEQRQLAAAFASQVAMAMERAALADEARQAWERVEAEFLRNTLLSGVSHDLRTPLAAITGAVSSLIETGESLPPEARAEMLDTIHSEAERMERLINNLLDMTRLEWSARRCVTWSGGWAGVPSRPTCRQTFRSSRWTASRSSKCS
jgi:two-component system sensor histidine kinase KdpD